MKNKLFNIMRGSFLVDEKSTSNWIYIFPIVTSVKNARGWTVKMYHKKISCISILNIFIILITKSRGENKTAIYIYIITYKQYNLNKIRKTTTTKN